MFVHTKEQIATARAARQLYGSWDGVRRAAASETGDVLRVLVVPAAPAKEHLKSARPVRAGASDRA
ncbi:MAG: hypothetical protein RQ833_11870 [Sphingomonadaceae bacterium]|nr:hypothetical protein [Sphingomonadaceae bacterium]